MNSPLSEKNIVRLPPPPPPPLLPPNSIHPTNSLPLLTVAPKNPIVLCHGLFGFSELQLLPGNLLPSIEYWRDLRPALELHGMEVIIASVPPSASIAHRAEALAELITKQAPNRSVNLIGHSMGGLDARYLLSKLKPNTFKPLSLTTIATPHHGSPVADYILDSIPPEQLPKLYAAVNALGLETDAFAQLTTSYLRDVFNPSVLDVPGVGYYSYGARFDGPPRLYSWFRWSWGVIEKLEKELGIKSRGNDGLVSVESAKWGTYEGTLVGVSHLEVVNWYNRLEGVVGGLVGRKKAFDGVAFYCAVGEKLAKRGY